MWTTMGRNLFVSAVVTLYACQITSPTSGHRQVNIEQLVSYYIDIMKYYLYTLQIMQHCSQYQNHLMTNYSLLKERLCQYQLVTVICVNNSAVCLSVCAFSALTLWQEGHLACKKRVLRCWHGCLSGARCRLAYGPADATATHCLLLQ